jgi:hypothetical protein
LGDPPFDAEGGVGFGTLIIVYFVTSIRQLKATFERAASPSREAYTL